MRQLEHLAHKQPFGEGRVRLGFGFDGYYLPKETVVDLFNRVRGLGIKLITSHYTNTPIYGREDPIPGEWGVGGVEMINDIIRLTDGFLFFR